MLRTMYISIIYLFFVISALPLLRYFAFIQVYSIYRRRSMCPE